MNAKIRRQLKVRKRRVDARIDLEWRDRPQLFGGQSQSLPRGSEDGHVRASCQQGLDEVASLVQDVLAVVQHDEHPPVAYRLREQIGRASCRERV